MNKLFLTYTITNQTTKEIYFIQVTENDSVTKAKNLLAKTLFPILMDNMQIYDAKIIEDNKSSMLKSIRKSIFTTYSGTQEGYKSIEVTGDIKNVVNTEKAIVEYTNNQGEVIKLEKEIINYKSKLLPNIELCLIVNEHDYVLSERTTMARILISRTKTPAKIEAMILDREIKEEILMEQIAKLINKRNEDAKIVEVEVIETITPVVEGIGTPLQAQESIQIKDQSIIYTHENISIYAEIELYTSNISNTQYNQIKYLTITKDNQIYWEGYRLGFPLNAPKSANVIDFVNYQEYICKFIISQEINNIADYWTKLELSKLIQDMQTTNFDIRIKTMKRNEAEQIKQLEYKEKQNKIDLLASEIETICNDKQLVFYKDYSNIIIIANAEYYSKKDRIISTLKSCIDVEDNNMSYNKWFKPFELVNISLNYTNNLELLQDAKKLIS